MKSASFGCVLIASLWTADASADPKRDEAWREAAVDYFAAEDLANGVYVGLGAAAIGAGRR